MAEPEPSAPEERASLLPGPLERAADRALAALRHAPLLALLATAAALFELALGRVGWHGLTDVVETETVRELGRLARFPRNLAAVAGMVALLAALLQLIRFPGWAALGRRLAIAAFAGIFVPCVLVATFLPLASLRPRLVVFGLAAAHVLVSLIALSAVRYRGPLGVRLAVVGVGGAAFLTLLVTGLGQLSDADTGWRWLAAAVRANPGVSQSVSLGLRNLGEALYHAALLGGAWTVIVGQPSERSRLRIGVALALGLPLALAFVGFASLGGYRFQLMLFGSFRVMLVLESVPWLYALPLVGGLVGGLVGVGRERPESRQLGMALVLWLAAGYGPHTPIQLLYLVLATLLFVRSAQAYDPAGDWRMRHPWSQLGRRR